MCIRDRPITLAPIDFNHWQAISPTPPAAAWNKTVWPDSTLKVLLIRYSAVIPLSIIDAASSSEMSSGILTKLFIGKILFSA